SVDFCRVSNSHITGDELRKHELMHGGGCGVNVFEAPRVCELLRTQLVANEDVRVLQLLAQVFQGGDLREGVLGKPLVEAPRQPGRRVPQPEAMMDRDQYLQRSIRRSRPVISFGCGRPSMPRTVGEMSCSEPSPRSLKPFALSETTMNGTG